MMREEINKELRELGSSLADVRIPIPYQLPGGYFAAFEKNILACTINHQQETALPAIGNPYAAPVGYFESLPDRLQQRLPKTPKKGILITFRQVRWAAAAVLLVMIGVGGYNVYKTTGNSNANGFEILASVADGDIQEYLGPNYLAEAQSNSTTVEKMDVPTADIVDYLDETGWDNETF